MFKTCLRTTPVPKIYDVIANYQINNLLSISNIKKVNPFMCPGWHICYRCCEQTHESVCRALSLPRNQTVHFFLSDDCTMYSRNEVFVGSFC